jgi:hypothetical protein
VGVQVATSVGEWREARELAQSNLAREALGRSSLALGEEREAAYLGALAPEGALPAQRAESDKILGSLALALDRLGDERSLREFRALQGGLAELRHVQDSGANLRPGLARDALAAHVLAAHDELTLDLLSLRRTLLARRSPATG